MTHLVANLGAEEPRPPPAPARPLLARLGRLWALLFADDVTLETALGDDAARWPDALGPRPEGPAFDWLPRGDVTVAWLPRSSADWGPSPDVVWRVHDKAFAAETAPLLDDPLAPLVTVFEPDALTADAVIDTLARWPAWARADFALKPRRGGSGRGRVPGRAHVDDKVRRGLPGLARRGGALLEPWVPRTEDLSTQLFLHAGGATEHLATTRQRLTPSGIYLGNRGTFDAEGRPGAGRHAPALLGAADVIADAARARGFFGVCGIDAFTWRGPDDTVHLRPLVEVNARFTTGTIAIGLLARARDAGRIAGARSWAFTLDAPRPTPGVEVLPLDDEGAALSFAVDDDALDVALDDTR